MKYREYLQLRLSSIVPDDFVYPSGYDVIGHVVLLQTESDDSRYLSALGKATLEFEKRARSVVVRTGPTTGITRTPSYRLIAGDSVTETIHNEDGVLFKLDPLVITFSGGNLGERIRVRNQVRPREVVVDMFAGVGQFALHAALQEDVQVMAIEISDSAFHYLVENVRLNSFEDKVNPVLGDCRKVHPERVADRVYLGFLHDTVDYLPQSLETLRDSGGAIHMHMAHPMEEVAENTDKIVRLCASYGFASHVENREVKWYSPGIRHVVYDIDVFRE
jgi:tRNA wybutosine-synthesizing protein 2